MFERRWYQEEAEAAFFDFFERHPTGNPLIAMPTGTGKSVVLGNIVKRIMIQWPTQRLMMLTHVKELIEQNARKLKDIWPQAPLGVYSAGLKQRDITHPVIFGGVQSVSGEIKRDLKTEVSHKILRHFGFRDLVFIDEAHLLSPKDDTMYQYVIQQLTKLNPRLRVVGLTATPYRTKQGTLTENGVFTHIAYDLTTLESFNRLIAEGYLAPLIPRPTKAILDTSKFKIVAGEYTEASIEQNMPDELMFLGVQEMVELGADRNSWLIFAPGVKKAETIVDMLRYLGISAAAVHSKNLAKENDAIIEAFKRGEIRAIVNANKLTTGFDHPPIDLIGVFRPTLSTGLWVQMLGRGTRPSYNTGKRNCLVLDFARNTPRLGPINDPVIPGRPRTRGETGDMPIRVCHCCGVYNHTAARSCINCGVEFSFENKIFETAGTQELIRGDAPVIETFPVNKVIYNLHEKRDQHGNMLSPPMIKVSYFAGFRRFDEYVMLEHNGRAGRISRDWWKQRHAEEPPLTTHAALAKVSELRTPRSIRVHVNLKYPEILSCEW